MLAVSFAQPTLKVRASSLSVDHIMSLTIFMWDFCKIFSTMQEALDWLRRLVELRAFKLLYRLQAPEDDGPLRRQATNKGPL